MANFHQGNKQAINDALPLFHSFGCTVTLWYPIIYGVDMVTYPTPLETKKLAELVEKHSVTVMIATPTFLRSYIKRCHEDDFKSLRLLVTGAEKLPQAIAKDSPRSSASRRSRPRRATSR